MKNDDDIVSKLIEAWREKEARRTVPVKVVPPDPWPHRQPIKDLQQASAEACARKRLAEEAVIKTKEMVKTEVELLREQVAELRKANSELETANKSADKQVAETRRWNRIMLVLNGLMFAATVVSWNDGWKNAIVNGLKDGCASLVQYFSEKDTAAQRR